MNYGGSLGIFHNFKHGNWSDLAGYVEDPSWIPEIGGFHRPQFLAPSL